MISAVESLEKQSKPMSKSFEGQAVKRMLECGVGVGMLYIDVIYTDVNAELKTLGNHAHGLMQAIDSELAEK